MMRRIVLAVAIVIVVGLLSALVSVPSIERRREEEIGADWLTYSKRPLVSLADRELGIAPIEPEAIQVASIGGAAGRLLARQNQRLPLTEAPRAWVAVRARVIAPFFVQVDSDGAAHIGASATTRHERTLDLAIFGFSHTVSYWATGGLYCGTRAPANSPLQPTATAPPSS